MSASLNHCKKMGAESGRRFLKQPAAKLELVIIVKHISLNPIYWHGCALHWPKGTPNSYRCFSFTSIECLVFAKHTTACITGPHRFLDNILTGEFTLIYSDVHDKWRHDRRTWVMLLCLTLDLIWKHINAESWA